MVNIAFLGDVDGEFSVGILNIVAIVRAYGSSENEVTTFQNATLMVTEI